MTHYFTTKVKDIQLIQNILVNMFKPNKLIIYYIYHNKQVIATHEINNKTINYTKEHYMEGMQANMPYKEKEEIEKYTNENLKKLDELLINK